jgi:hypothetical protein
MEFDADAAPNFGGSKVNFGDGGDGLAIGVERGGDIVVFGEKAERPWSLGAERGSGTGERDGE